MYVQHFYNGVLQHFGGIVMKKETPQYAICIYISLDDFT